MFGHDLRWDPVDVLASLEVEPVWVPDCNDRCCGSYHYHFQRGSVFGHLWIDIAYLDVGLELQVDDKPLIRLNMQSVNRIERRYDPAANIDELLFVGEIDQPPVSNLPEGFILCVRPHLELVLNARGR